MALHSGNPGRLPQAPSSLEPLQRQRFSELGIISMSLEVRKGSNCSIVRLSLGLVGQVLGESKLTRRAGHAVPQR